MSAAVFLVAELVVAAALYRSAARRVRGWPAWRGACFAAGLGALALALLGLDGPRSLTVHMAQHLVLAFVAAPLLVLGSPLALGLRATRAQRALRAAWVARPGVGWVALAGLMAVSQVPSVYEATARHPLMHVAEHVAWLGAAVLFWRVVAGADPVPHRPGPLGRLLYLLLFSAPMGATGAWLMWSSAPWYPGHSLADQRDAGVLMLVGGGLALAAITVAVAWAAILREHRRQLAYEQAVAR
jgi:cytochrome c oxidase assembly factor CtaG